MLFFEILPTWGIVLTSFQETLLDTSVLSLLSAPFIWLFSMRPLAQKINIQQSEVEEQSRLNTELHMALDIHALVSIADSRGRITHVNDKFCEVSGYSVVELLGQDHRIVNSGSHDKSFIRNLWNTITAGKVWQGEICNRRKDGRPYWVDSTIVPLLDSRGKPEQYISIRRDITVQKNTEIKLVALRRALDASSEMIVIADAESRIQYVNPALCGFTGWSDSQLIGRHARILDNIDSDQDNITAMENALSSGEPWFGRVRNRRLINAAANISAARITYRKDYWAELSVTPIFNHDKTVAGFVQIQRDVTAQMDREQALHEEKQNAAARIIIAEALHQIKPLEERFRMVVDTLLTLKGFNQQQKGIVLLKAPGEDYLQQFVVCGSFSEAFLDKTQHLRCDSKLCGRTGVSAKHIKYGNCLTDPANEVRSIKRDAHGHCLVPIVSAEEDFGLLFLYSDYDLLQSDFRLTLLTQVGEMMALALLQQQTKAALEHSRDAALQAALTKSQILANMSHEIRTPMNGVLGMLDLLKDTDLTSEQWGLIQTAANSAEALLDVINDILDFSKLEAGKFELEKIEFDMAALVEDVCSLMASRAHAKGLDLNCFVPATLPHRWRGDPTRIRQVMINLTGNAVKFTEAGEVSVNINELSETDGFSGIRIEVMDTGIGMTQETQAQIYQPFSQADSSTSRRYGGTGLGLSICRDLVSLMEGEIGFDSVPGQGTRFWVTLPLSPSAVEFSDRSVDFSGKRVLVVDDNATNRIIVEHHLLHWGLKVVQAENAKLALNHLNAVESADEPFALVLSDLNLPDMDGYAFIHKMNENPVISDIPKIVWSSSCLSNEIERMDMGVSHSLLKPVRQADLFDAIADVLQKSTEDRKCDSKSENLLPDYSDKQVMVVEDNKVNQKVISAMLARYQLKPKLVENGLEALNELAEKNYDLVLMDCQMPVMDGYEAARQIRALQSHQKHIPVVALTAHAAAGEREKCISAGMNDYLTKPIDRNKLTALLSQWLGGSISTVDKSQVNKTLDTCTNFVWNETEALKCLDDDEELLNDIVRLFLDEVPAKLTALDVACQNMDFPAITDMAHVLKGMLSHFSAKPLVELAGKLESSRNQNLDDARVIAAELIACTNILLACLQQRKGKSYE